MSRTDAATHDHVAGTHVTRRGVLWVGLRCDVRCKFCYDEHLASRDKVWIPLKEATRTLDKFRGFYRNTALDFMGGEPTLHPHMVDIVRHAAGIGLFPTVITHGMHLADIDRVRSYVAAGIGDFLVSVHGIGDTVRAIHRRGSGNYERQRTALDNLRRVGIPFRFNVTMVRDNLAQLADIAQLAGDTGATVVNFLTFNPYFEWAENPEIEFQARHSEIAPHLMRAIDRCTELGVEANVRYMPLCRLPGYEKHVYTGYQLPYDPHEWDYNSWYDAGHPGVPNQDWYLAAAERQRTRHHYAHGLGCDGCALIRVCDGVHEQYAARWGDDEVTPYPGPAITDPTHFVRHQTKTDCRVHPPARDPATHDDAARDDAAQDHAARGHVSAAMPVPLTLTQFQPRLDNRAGIRAGIHGTDRAGHST